MKPKIILFLIFALAELNGWSQSSNTLNKESNIPSKLEVNQLSISKWNTIDGIPYRQGTDVNLGATSFEVLDESRIAFLCNSTSEIIIINNASGKTIKKFLVILAPRDFVYDNELFYVLNERYVVAYDVNGKEINKFSFPDAYLGTERLLRFSNETYLLLGNGNSLKIESQGLSISPQEHEGWITSTGYFIKTQPNSDNSYLVKVILSNGKSFNKIFAADKKVAGAQVIGSTANRVVLDVQTFISENPIAVDRTVVSIELTSNDLGAIVTNLKVPDSYYVLSNKEFYLSKNGTILNMVTSAQGLNIFSLIETKSNTSKGYPAYLTTAKYHFNDHLLETKEK